MRSSTDLYDLDYELGNKNGIAEVKLDWFLKKVSPSNVQDLVITTNQSEMKGLSPIYKFVVRTVIQYRNNQTTNYIPVELFYKAPSISYVECSTTIYIPSPQCVTHEYKHIGREWIYISCFNIHKNVMDKLKCKFVFKLKNPPTETLPQKQINKDLLGLLENPKFFDVTIKSNEGTEIHAHKAILAARSPVFRAHFENDMVENRTNIVQFQMNTKVLQGVLRYIYSEEDAVDFNKSAEELLMAADFFQITSLKVHCEKVLSKMLRIHNVIKNLQIAYLYSAEDLKLSCFKFINSSDGNAIINSESWKEMKSMEFFKDVAEYMITHPHIE